MVTINSILKEKFNREFIFEDITECVDYTRMVENSFDDEDKEMITNFLEFVYNSINIKNDELNNIKNNELKEDLISIDAINGAVSYDLFNFIIENSELLENVKYEDDAIRVYGSLYNFYGIIYFYDSQEGGFEEIILFKNNLGVEL